MPFSSASLLGPTVVSHSSHNRTNFFKNPCHQLFPMQRTATLVFTLVLLLVASLLIAGCSSDQTAQTGTATLTPQTGALYTSGDVVRIPASSVDTAWLIMGYDPATDTYERALIYPNADGRWGVSIGYKDREDEPGDHGKGVHGGTDSYLRVISPGGDADRYYTGRNRVGDRIGHNGHDHGPHGSVHHGYHP